MNKFDKIFKQKLSHAHTPVGIHNWEKIAARLDDNSNAIRPRLWPFRLALAGMIIIIFVIGSTWISNTKPFTKNENLDIASPNTKEELNSYGERDHQVTIVDKADINEVNKPNKIINNSNGLNILGKENDIHASVTSISKNSLIESKQTNAIDNNSNVALTFHQGIASLQNETNDEQPIALAHTDQVLTSLDNISNSQLSPLSLRLSNFAEQLSFSKGRSLKIKNKTPNKTIPSCPFTLETNNKSLELYVSHDYIVKSLDGPHELSDVISKRKQSESSRYSFSAGFRFGFTLIPRVNILLGANYSQMNEKFSYIDPESNQERTITIKDYIYENGKIVDSIITTEVVQLPGTSTIKKQNKFTSFDIPILGRYTLLGTRDISLSAITGPIINVSYGHTGMIIGTDSKPIDISNDVYKPQLGIRLYTGLSLAYHIAGDLDFVFEPNARISFDNVTKDKYPISQRNQSFGLHTGLRYKF